MYFFSFRKSDSEVHMSLNRIRVNSMSTLCFYHTYTQKKIYVNLEDTKVFSNNKLITIIIVSSIFILNETLTYQLIV